MASPGLFNLLTATINNWKHCEHDVARFEQMSTLAIINHDIKNRVGEKLWIRAYADVINLVAIISKKKINIEHFVPFHLIHSYITNEDTYIYFIHFYNTSVQIQWSCKSFNHINNFTTDDVNNILHCYQFCQFFDMIYLDNNSSYIPPIGLLPDVFNSRRKLKFKNIETTSIDIILDFNKQNQEIIKLNKTKWYTNTSLLKSVCDKKNFLIQIKILDNSNISELIFNQHGFISIYQYQYMKYVDSIIDPFINSYSYPELDLYVYNDVKSIIMSYLANIPYWYTYAELDPYLDKNTKDIVLSYIPHDILSVSFTDQFASPIYLRNLEYVEISIKYKEIKNEKIKTKLFLIMCDEVC